ncbi:MAG: prepilin-type N-terminal cleavage/methylation domain-containing protein [Abditibacteriaceae bacterium]
MSRKKAFTLIEILVVIGIIALLAAILFPVLSRARERARATSCMNNEHQIALAIMQYVQDHDRRYPPIDAAGADGWTTALKVSDGNIFQCPSEGQAPSLGFTDYWLNAELMWSNDYTVRGLSDVRVRYPANTILIGDGTAHGTDYAFGAALHSIPDPPNPLPIVVNPWTSSDPYANRHFGGANYAFADGHVKWLNAASINTTDAASGNNFAFRVTPGP